MARIAPASLDLLQGFADLIAFHNSGAGFISNRFLTMARRPEVARAWAQLSAAINGSGSTIDAGLRNMIAQVSSRAAGCGYCMAHTAGNAAKAGVSDVKEQALWEYETSPLYSEAERCALRVAQSAAQVPNAVTDQDFDALKKHYSDDQILDIVLVISMFGFMNRFNDTLATELESSPLAAGRKFLAPNGWSVGKHG